MILNVHLLTESSHQFIQLGTRHIDNLVRAANLPEVSRTRQRVQYFFRNHLSNVLVRVSDRRIAYPFLGNFDHYESEEVSSHDYYPFGTELRKTENIYGFHTDQRFAFNGKEISHKTGGQTNYDYGFRIYNAGLGRFLSVDPLTHSYPWYTPYQFAGNTPIQAIDLDGLEEWKINGGGTVNGPYANQQAAQSAALSGTASVNLDPVDINAKRSTYDEKLQSRLQNPSVLSMVTGLSTVGNRLFGSPFNPNKVLELNEGEKQNVFNESSNKTIAVLFSEFVEGTGCETRCFDQTQPITRDIANSYTTNLFLNWLMPSYSNRSIKNGEEGLKTIFTSPDNSTSYWQSFAAHTQAMGNLPAFFTGSLDYYYKLSGHYLEIRVHNEYSISSGITRNKMDDLQRQPGVESKLGNTTQWFEFTIDLNKLTK